MGRFVQNGTNPYILMEIICIDKEESNVAKKRKETRERKGLKFDEETHCVIKRSKKYNLKNVTIAHIFFSAIDTLWD